MGGITRTCVDCGGGITPVRLRARYCRACRKVRYQAAAAKRVPARANRAGPPSPAAAEAVRPDADR